MRSGMRRAGEFTRKRAVLTILDRNHRRMDPYDHLRRIPIIVASTISDQVCLVSFTLNFFLTCMLTSDQAPYTSGINQGRERIVWQGLMRVGRIQ
jgi:hypothetical protein